MVRRLHFQDRRLLNRRNILSGELLMSENSGVVFLHQPSPHPEKSLALCRLLLHTSGGVCPPREVYTPHASRPCLSLWRRLPDGTRIYFRSRPHKLAATHRRPRISEKSTFLVAASPANIQKITIKKIKSQIIS